MINLLPPEEKELLELKRIKNLVIFLCGIILISQVCLMLILLSVKFSALIKISFQKYVLEQAEKDYQPQDTLGAKDIIKKYNQIMPQMLSFYQKKIYLSDILAAVSEIQKPNGLYFTNISLDGEKYEDRVKVKISGVSGSRDGLLSFKKNIEERNEIKNVSFSPESWINPENINFNLTFDFLKNGY